MHHILTHKKTLLALGCLSSCFIVAAQANESHPSATADRVIFVDADPEIPNMACGSPIRRVSYVLQNTSVTDFGLYNIALITESEDTFTGTADVSITPSIYPPYVPAVPFCPVSVDNSFILPGGESCAIDIEFSPPPCDGSDSLPLSEVVDRRLQVEIYSAQELITADVNTEVTLLGASEDFAVLGENAVSDGTNGPATIVGNLGSITTAPTGDFAIFDGEPYIPMAGVSTSYNPYDVLWWAAEDFGASYRMFVNATTGASACDPITIDLSGGFSANSGYYCLTNGANDIQVGGTVALSGPGNFVFVVNKPGNTAQCSSSANFCSLEFMADTTFSYSNGASPDNVYWVVYSLEPVNPNPIPGNVYLDACPTSGAQVDGTIMAIGSILHRVPVACSGPRIANMSAVVNGRLLSDGNVTLDGDTVAIHPLLAEFAK